MVRLADLPPETVSRITALDCPEYTTFPFVAGPPLAQRRIALMSTAGLHHRTDRPFTDISGDYRVIKGDTASRDLLLSHISVNFDRTGFQQDWNVVFPLDRLRDLVRAGLIGSVADYHYSFMGAADPRQMEATARELARMMKNDQVTGVLLVPV